jgi:hypothetical protein
LPEHFILGETQLYNLLLADDRPRRALGVSSVERSVEPSGSFQNGSGRWIVIQREQKFKAIWARVETTPKSQNGLVGAGLAPDQGDRQGIAPTAEFEYTPIKPFG